MRSVQRFRSLLLVSFMHLAFNSPAQSEPNNDSDLRVQQAVEKLDQQAQKYVDERNVVGLALGVIYKDKLIFSKGYGPREIGKDAKIDSDTVFQLASVSKPVSATVVASLVGDGKISWDAKISDLDPSFQLQESFVTKEITIRDLYCHRSGLPEHAGDLLEDMGYNRAQVLHRLRYQKPYSSFRSHYAYTNFGLTEGAVAASKAYGLTWEDAASQKLFNPLAMNSSSAKYSDYVSRANRAPGHLLVDGKWIHKADREPDAQSPAGGVSSSVNDLSKWIRLILANGKFDGKRIVDEKALDEIRKPQILVNFSPFTGLPGFYGLGMNVGYDEQGRLRLGHSGAFAMGNATAISMVPSEQLGVVVLTNTYPVGIAETLTTSFVDNALYGRTTQDWFAVFKKVFSNPATLGLDKSFDYSKPPLASTPPLKNSTYVGTYNNDFFGIVSIAESAGSLTILEGPNKMSFPLKHYDRDTFTYLPPGENSAGLSGVTFSIGPSGIAQSVLIENLNEDGQGTFQRVSP